MSTNTDQPPPYPGEDPIVYPGRMTTYPGYTRGQPPIFVHDCVQGCPGMPFRPGQPGYIAPPKGMEHPPIQVPPPPGYQPSPGQPQFPGHRPMPPSIPVIGANGEPIFYHPHFPQLRSDICKSCKHVIPIRPMKFSKKLTKEQIEEFKECFQVTITFPEVSN